MSPERFMYSFDGLAGSIPVFYFVRVKSLVQFPEAAILRGTTVPPQRKTDPNSRQTQSHA